uniref:Neur_chan_LBD domain-containing protein n=1 Tax=Rhabditophanes sp. KR3021 TaxID=114890 RepID=A0AC35U6L0_9BILA
MRTIKQFLLIICCLFIVNGQPNDDHTRQKGIQKLILHRIFSDYDPSIRPPPQDTSDHSSIIVMTNLFISKVKFVHDQVELDVTLRQQWPDSRLAYQVDAREGIQEIKMKDDSKKIWVPETYFAKSKVLSNYQNPVNYVIEPSGYIRSKSKYVLETSVVNSQSFPFSTQKQVTLKLSSQSYKLEEVAYVWSHAPPGLKPVEVADAGVLGGYTFSEAFAGDCVGNYTMGSHSCIFVTLHFNGSFSRNFTSALLPSLLLLIASWLHFFIHPTWSVPRSISAALPFILFASLVLFSKEKFWAQHESSGMGVWFAFCLIMTFLSFLEYFIVIIFTSKRKDMHYVLPSNGVSTHIHEPKATNTTNVPVELVVQAVPKSKTAKFFQNVDYVSRILFPLAFIIYVVVHLIFAPF